MVYILIGFGIFLALFLQTSSTTMPIFLGVLLSLYIYHRQSWVFFLAFFSGILLDILLVRTVGLTS
ncbi:MAG: hypothetical protein KBD46_03700, partial [Candidatus Levybacteria bacterium]|nr:hypothetical protein [Candidatus Levybacteria bacterium]